ncbi:hypothetical protein KP509_02G030000 [Ceratopteris richardii]|nr:hypothetical protein KP509_02G030000 [Ceratopteris richardii]
MSVSTVESTTKIAWQRRSASSHMLDSEISLEIMDIFCSKDSAAHSSDFDYSNPFFSGSPPCRASNPIVHDAEFRQLRQKPVYLEKLDDKKSPVQDLVSCHRRLVSPASATPQSKQKISSPRYKSSPRVRIEGFDCSGHVFDCAGLDSRRQVPAMA